MKLIRGVLRLFRFFGIDLKHLSVNVRNLPMFLKDYMRLKKLRGNDADFPFVFPKAMLRDRTDEGGTMKGHYFHQDLYIAQIIHDRNPKVHLDIGSRVDGFVAHVASYRKIKIMDIRPIKSTVKNIEFFQGDIMSSEMLERGQYESISCLHVIEHMGLGRYGDDIDYNGHRKALNTIYEMLVSGGIFYFSTPIGRQRIEFNAHRVFGLDYLLEYFEGKYKILSFAYVDDSGDLHSEVELSSELVSNNANCKFGCGIFELQKLGDRSDQDMPIEVE
ncbi:MAG: DUF268 domain-containing protein [Bacteroidota bacterium]